MEVQYEMMKTVDVGEYTAEEYYIATDGSDDNDGLSASTPCATLSHVLGLLEDTLSTDIVINFESGTYTESMTVSGFDGYGSLTLLGDATTPSNVVLGSLTVTSCDCTINIQGISL